MIKVGQLVTIPDEEMDFYQRVNDEKLPLFGKVVRVTQNKFAKGKKFYVRVKVRPGFELTFNHDDLKPYIMNEPEGE